MPKFSKDTDDQHEERTLGHELGDTYFTRLGWVKAQDDLKLRFFASASESFEDQALAQRTVEIPDDQASNAEGFLELYHAGWQVIGELDGPDPDAPRRFVLKEDPQYKPYSEVVALEPWIAAGRQGKDQLVYGYVITRSIVEKEPLFDDERCKVVDRDFYNEVTEWENFWLTLELNLDELDLYRAQWPRVLKSVEDLTPEQIERIKAYLYSPAPTVKLLVRYAKREEAEEA